jgi:DNA-binding CsgD family transcriptional regulator
MLALWAIDSEFYGVGIQMPSSTEIVLSPQARKRWQALTSHIAAAHRLRRSLGQTPRFRRAGTTSLPLGAEAVLDPTRGAVVEAGGKAKANEALTAIRDAAIRSDVAKGRLRATEPNEALRLWEALIRGRWSLVDWFDTDQRRFVLALPNAPGVRDPRGLTEREYEVALRVRAGESSKGIAYELGISPSRVSHLRRCAMRKLGARTVGEFVGKMRMF